MRKKISKSDGVETGCVPTIYLSAKQLCRFQFALALMSGTYLFLAESNLFEC